MKKILFSVAVIATIAIAGWNYQQNKEVELSDLAMENVEALAQGEIENYYNFKLKSYDNGCKICKPETGSWCNVHDQVPC